jgi:predicted amino acid-binding ACT domain protein
MTTVGDFTALILITGIIKPDIESAILNTLAPFTIKILDKQSMRIRDRYFLAIYLSLDKAHAKAIEADLKSKCKSLDIDLAIDYQTKNTTDQ